MKINVLCFLPYELPLTYQQYQRTKAKSATSRACLHHVLPTALDYAIGRSDLISSAFKNLQDLTLEVSDSNLSFSLQTSAYFMFWQTKLLVVPVMYHPVLHF
jgi:hypothetical protein